MDLPLLAAALATIPLLILDEATPSGTLRVVATIGDWVVWIVFALDLVVMLWLSERPWAYARRNPINVLVVVLTPPLVPVGLQAVRVARVLRVIRLIRFAPIARRFFSLQGVQYATVLAAVALFGGAAAYSAAEKHGYGTGIYWAIQTLTTVGYGDVSPVTTLGRVIACVLMLVGIGFFAIITGAIAQRFVANEIIELEQDVDATDTEILKQIAVMSEQLQRLEATVRRRASG